LKSSVCRTLSWKLFFKLILSLFCDEEGSLMNLGFQDLSVALEEARKVPAAEFYLLKFSNHCFLIVLTSVFRMIRLRRKTTGVSSIKYARMSESPFIDGELSRG
jgi:hypothetical protein